jgi:hypothetical protein
LGCRNVRKTYLKQALPSSDRERFVRKVPARILSLGR